MGDSNEPELFMGSFYPLVSRWNEEMAEVQGNQFQVVCPFSSEQFDAHLGAFIDDLFKILLVPDGTALQALQLDAIDNNALSEALNIGGYTQNRGKQDTLISLGTHGATKDAQRHIKGNAVQDLTHIGGHVHVANNNRREVEARLQSGNVGWTRLGDYWFSGGPWKAKRLSFLPNVAGRLWSGQESYVLSPREIRRLDSSLARKLRAMMKRDGSPHR